MPATNISRFGLACDRCRSYKLKCPKDKTSTSTDACERCLRAKVRCNFSPRARTGRPSEHILLKAADGEPVKDRKRRRQAQLSNSIDARSCSNGEDTSDEDLNDARQSVTSASIGDEPIVTTDMPDPQSDVVQNFPFLPTSSQLDINVHYFLFLTNIDERFFG